MTNTSSKVSIDCRISTKKKIPKSNGKIHLNSPLTNIKKSEEINSAILNKALRIDSNKSHKSDFELAVISTGRTILIKTNSYKTNLY